MKKLCFVLAIFVIGAFLCGFAPKETKYFTLHYEGQKIVVTDRTLKPAWYNFDSYTDFVKGRTIYQRAEQAKTISKDFPEIYKILKKIERTVERDTFDGNIHFDPNAEQKFWVTGAQDGIEMDVAAAAKEILAALKNKKHADIIIKTKLVPHKTEKKVLSKIVLRAQYSTRFDAGNVGRSSNIKRSVECFNGNILAPREELSFNKTVGARTAARGYAEAKVIMDGEFVPGIGGGVCQTSTTLFNAALLSGLCVVESHNHSLPISYVQLGRDAMVSSVVDLVLRNNTGASIYIEAGVQNGNTVYVKIYGANLGNIRYKPVAEVSAKPQEVEVIGETPTSMEGYRKIVIEKGVPARSAKTYLEAYSGNRLVNKKLVRKSNYKGKVEIIKYEQIPLTQPDEIDIIV